MENFRAVVFVMALCLSLLWHKQLTLIVLDKSLGKDYSGSYIYISQVVPFGVLI